MSVAVRWMVGMGLALVLGRWIFRGARLPAEPVVLITGGSRGLGLALAEEWAARGASLSLCARDRVELDQAAQRLPRARVLVQTCDLARGEQIQDWVACSLEEYGRIDVLINNAGIMEVGPVESLDEAAFRRVLEINLHGLVRTTLAVLPHLKPGASIVNITSIGGAVAIPHLLPYSVSKFGALGFSLGLASELRRKRISVTSVLPGLMRTGSIRHARFRGESQSEFGWFARSSGLPGLTLSAGAAARRIVDATLQGRRFLVLGGPAKVLRLVASLLPGLTVGFLGALNRLLPSSPSKRLHSGREFEPSVAGRSWLVRRAGAGR